MIDLNNFIITGKYGELEIGETLDLVLTKLGPPDHQEPARKSYPEFLLYGPLELRFRDGKLEYIGLKVDYESNIANHIDDCKNVYVKKKIFEVIELLLNNGVEYNADKIMTDYSQTVLVTKNSVHLAFDSDGFLSKIASVKK